MLDESTLCAISHLRLIMMGRSLTTAWSALRLWRRSSASAKRGGAGDAGEPLEERLPASGLTRLEDGEALV